MKWLRYGLPAAIVLAGVVLLVVEPNTVGLEGAAGIVGAGLAVLLLNWLHRIGVAGESERDAEDRARAYFDEHGVWPDEVPRRRPEG